MTAREDAHETYRDAERQGILLHKSRGTIVAGVPPKSDAALWCAGFRADKKREILNKAPIWADPRALAHPALSGFWWTRPSCWAGFDQ